MNPGFEILSNPSSYSNSKDALSIFNDNSNDGIFNEAFPFTKFEIYSDFKFKIPDNNQNTKNHPNNHIEKQSNQTNVNNTKGTKDTSILQLKRKRGKPGRKRICESDTDSETKKVHDKMSTDNILSKIKKIVTDSAYDCINRELAKIYSIKKTSKKNFKKQLIKIKYGDVRNVKLKEINNYSKKSLKDIFTGDKSDKFKNFQPDHNKILIEESLKDTKDEERENLEKLYNMKFIEYLDIYCGKNTEYNPKLDILKTFDELCKKQDFEEDYQKILKDYLWNFQEKLDKIQIRREKKKLLNDNEI